MKRKRCSIQYELFEIRNLNKNTRDGMRLTEISRSSMFKRNADRIRTRVWKYKNNNLSDVSDLYHNIIR